MLVVLLKLVLGCEVAEAILNLNLDYCFLSLESRTVFVVGRMGLFAVDAARHRIMYYYYYYC